jgi:hypothetical protein
MPLNRRTAVLARLSSFVPQLAAANETLAAQMAHRPAHAFDVEHLGEGESEGRHVAMDLACGVLDLRTEAAAEAAERAMAAGGAVALLESDSDSDSDSDDEDYCEEGGILGVPLSGPADVPVSGPAGQKRPHIEELR